MVLLRGVLKFKNTLNFIKENGYKNASSNMMKSLWAKQTPNRAKKACRHNKKSLKADAKTAVYM
ncbi:hypothetical protein CHL10075_00095 [Campylobacter hyointestinalis subsp. lawsonii]|nr:hypothetical protein CHL10075_00095 [Campylobacter hyointestinalis subsp. lawsonii]